MSKSKTYTVKYRRKREGKTSYTKRLKLLTSQKTRICIRTSSNNISIQAIEFNNKGDKIIGYIDSQQLKKLGWNSSTGNIPTSYLTGFLFAKKFKPILNNIVIDIGVKKMTSRSRLSAVIKGLEDGEIKLNYNKKILPKQEDLEGKYLKNKSKPEDLPKLLEEIKSKI